MTIDYRVLYETYADVKVVSQSGDQVYAHCPLHDDTKDSLSFNQTTGLWTCHAPHGCGSGNAEQLFEKLGIPWPGTVNGDDPGPDSIEATYDYTDEAGTLLFQVVRRTGKAFRQRRPDGSGGWIWTIKDVRRVPYRLHDLVQLVQSLAESDPQPVVWIVEGEKDADRLWSLGWPATTNPGGAGKWRDEYAETLKAIGVTSAAVLPDNDDAGRKHGEAVGQSCRRAGLEVRLITLPGLLEKGDVSDWLDAGHTLEELVGLFEATPPGSEDTDPRPMFTLDGLGDLKADAERLWAQVTQVNMPPTLFQAGTLAWVEQDESGAPLVRQLTPPRLAHWLAGHIYFCATQKEGVVPKRPPAALIADMLATPEPPVPVLARVVRTPVFAADGTLHDQPGYDARTRAYYAPPPGFVVPPVTAAPTEAEVAAARAAVEEVFADFPFVGDADRAHVLAALITLVVRDLILGPTPLFLFTKPAPGTGASLCADCIVLLATGQLPPSMTQADEQEEWRKKLTAALITGPAIVYLDNLRGVIDSAHLASALTKDVWEDRILGRTEIVRVPIRAVWLATANNAQLATELARRAVRAKFDAKVERPWLRVRAGLVAFRHPELKVWVAEERARLVHALLTVVAAWLARGRPHGSVIKEDYVAWSRVVGGVLAVAGVDGFLGNLDELYEEQDVETDETKVFLGVWYERFRDKPVTTSQLFTLTKGDQYSPPLAPLPLPGRDDNARLASLGIWLRKQRDRWFDLETTDEQHEKHVSVRVERSGTTHRPTWRLAVRKPVGAA